MYSTSGSFLKSSAALLRVDLPTAPLALSLLERLWDFRAEVLPLGGGGYQILVEFDGDPAFDDRAREGLARIESWLESAGLDRDEIHLDDRPARLDIPVSKGLVCRVKTIALGAGVQVVSAEGELDLHAAPQLDDLLGSTEADHVILDLTETTFVDSTTMGVVVASASRIAEQDRQFSVVSGNRAVTRLLSVTGFDSVLDVHPTLPESVESALGRVVEAHASKRDEPAR